MKSQRALLSWSSGKDSAWALHVLRQQGDVEVVGLLTTFNSEFARVAMHAVREELVRLQARAVRLPLRPVQLQWPCSNEAYEAAMSEALARARDDGITHVAFGDLFLEGHPALPRRAHRGVRLDATLPAWDGPAFRRAIPVVRGAVVERDGFVFADLLPVTSEPVPAQGRGSATRSAE